MRQTSHLKSAIGTENAKKVTRLFDCFIGTLLVLLLSPLLIFIAILIKYDSRGPVLFTQKRYGENGSVFTIYKFRTMTHQASQQSFKQASAGDVRVTKFGAFLRRTSLDELPQIFNVVRGNMALVGPRPHPIELDDEFSCKIASYKLRFAVKPGITGLAQIRGQRGPTPTVEIMQSRIFSDIEFVNFYRVRTYIWIFCSTPLLLIFNKRLRGL